MESSSALSDSEGAEREDTADRPEGACSDANWPRNGQAAAIRQLVLPGMTPDLFLTAGDVLAARAGRTGLPADPVAAMRALAVAQGTAARTRI